jgi:pilus assembly protein Flp/PilA
MNAKRFSGDDGATMVEYALMVALIAVICIAAVTLIGSNSRSKFSQVGNSIQTGS